MAAVILHMRKEDSVMGKNIILCADGTGNKGGSTPDSNVYKVYNAIDIQYTGRLTSTLNDAEPVSADQILRQWSWDGEE